MSISISIFYIENSEITEKKSEVNHLVTRDAFYTAMKAGVSCHPEGIKKKDEDGQIRKAFFSSKEFDDAFSGDQLRGLQKEKEIGNWLYVVGLHLESMKLPNGIISTLEELDSYLSNVDQSVGGF